MLERANAVANARPARKSRDWETHRRGYQGSPNKARRLRARWQSASFAAREGVLPAQLRVQRRNPIPRLAAGIGGGGRRPAPMAGRPTQDLDFSTGPIGTRRPPARMAGFYRDAAELWIAVDRFCRAGGAEPRRR